MPLLEHLGGFLEEGTREDCLNLPGICRTDEGHCSLMSPILLHKR